VPFPHDTPGQLAPATRNRRATSPDFVKTQIVTLRVHRTWFDRLKFWRRAYQTKISDSRGEVIGSGSSPEASQEAAERSLVEVRKALAKH